MTLYSNDNQLSVEKIVEIKDDKSVKSDLTQKIALRDDRYKIEDKNTNHANNQKSPFSSTN